MIVNMVVVGDKELKSRLMGAPARVAGGVWRTLYQQGLELQRHIVADKLTGQVLNVVTGALRRSIQLAMSQDGDLMRATVYSAGDVKYARIHEFGFSGVEHVVAHTRMQTQVFGRVVSPFQVNVGAHDRMMNMPQRSFMRTGLADRQEPATKAIMDAVMAGMTGR